MPKWMRSVGGFVQDWWAEMTGALSVPFAILALAGAPPAKLYYLLGYAALWVVVLRQGIMLKRIEKRNARSEEISELINSGLDLIQTRTEEQLRDWLDKVEDLAQRMGSAYVTRINVQSAKAIGLMPIIETLHEFLLENQHGRLDP
jgi:NhaP-type Na+/H+ and K+/H+ antiporter